MFKLATVLLLALLAFPFLPESVRVLLPAGWQLKIPRIEFVHGGDGHDKGQSTGPGLASGSERDRVESSAMVPELSLDAVAVEPRDESVAVKPVHARPTRRPHRAARRVVQPQPEVEEEPEGLTYVPDYAVSVVPTRIHTEVRLSPTSASDAGGSQAAAQPAQADENATRQEAAPAAAAEDDKDWPLLCGQVVDGSGTPVAGAHVELESPPLTVSTDAHGRFCVACPAGNRTLRIEAAGRGRATNVVALRGSIFEMRIQLTPGP
jgi:hypothetical protein